MDILGREDAGLTLWVERPHVLGLVRVVGPDLDLVLQRSVRVALKEHLVGGHVKDLDDLLGVGHQLAVEVDVKVTQVFAVDVQEWELQSLNLQEKTKN